MRWNNLKRVIGPRLWPVYLIGFISGLPLMLTITVLQAWLTSAQVSIVHISLFTLVGLPYTYKFLWAPFLDRYALSLPFCLTHRRKSWLLICQVVLAVIVLSMAYLSPEEHLEFVVGLAVLAAIFSATQDIVIDAYRTEYLLVEERGLGSAAFIFAYRIATLLSGGLGLILADHYGWRMYFIGMSILMLLGAGIVLRLPIVQENIEKSLNFIQTFLQPFRLFLQQRCSVLLLIFIILYKFGDAFTQSLGTTFFLRELHLTLSDVGILYKTIGFMSTVVGAYVGGFLLPTLGIYRSLWMFGLLQAMANVCFVGLAHYGAIKWLIIFSITLDLGASGMATVALLACLMTVCDIRHTAAQFALLTAVMSIGRIIAGPLAGFSVNAWGWECMFILGFLLSLPCFLLLPRLRSIIIRPS
ncbi:MAG: MFS transporter [Gammaproteobacteria bacterium]|nr:MFS transporter [Gammaproteobacteria bacterium]MCD8543095.1 MFS transporter [Gammaproteobacteria bacterium]